MPVYEYRCTQCEHLFERYQAVGEAAPECPDCGSPSRKVFRSVGLIFKGSGFHTTDYRRRGNGEKPPSAESTAAGASASSSSNSSSESSKSSTS